MPGNHSQKNDAILNRDQRVPFRRDDDEVTGLPFPRIGLSRQPGPTVQYMQGRLPWTVVLGQFLTGHQSQHGLPQFEITSPVDGARSSAAMCLAGSCQLLCSQFGQRDGFHIVSFVQLPETRMAIPPADSAITLTTSKTT